MQLDQIEHRFHVREQDNRVAVVLTQPGWACAEAAGAGTDYWYVSVQDLTPEGWKHRADSTFPGGLSYRNALVQARKVYALEAATR